MDEPKLYHGFLLRFGPRFGNPAGGRNKPSLHHLIASVTNWRNGNAKGAVKAKFALGHLFPVMEPQEESSWRHIMKNYLAVGVGLLAGTVIGAAAVSGPHAQEKPSLYLITEIDVFDPEGYEQEFVPKAQASIKAAGGKLLALGGGSAKPITSIEGTAPKRVGVQQWDSLEALKTWYNGREYQDALIMGKKYASFRRYAVEGQ
jgi:uncharacterized protein (DUF1330 family)